MGFYSPRLKKASSSNQSLLSALTFSVPTIYQTLKFLVCFIYSKLILSITQSIPNVV